MKIRTPFFILQFDILFIIVFFTYIFSSEIRKLLFSFYTCYLFIVFHELSHILIASIFGKEIKTFNFSLAGVSITLNNFCRINKYKEICIYLAGPLSNLVLAIIFSYNKMVYNINILLCIINLLPIFPLDGYNILYNLLRETKYDKTKDVILNKISLILYILLFIFSIFELLYKNNISILIFNLYILCINLKSKNDQKLVELLYKKRY